MKKKTENINLELKLDIIKRLNSKAKGKKSTLVYLLQQQIQSAVEIKTKLLGMLILPLQSNLSK